LKEAVNLSTAGELLADKVVRAL